MEDEKVEKTSPPRTRKILYKYLTVGLFFIVVFFAIGLAGVETTSSSSFCSSCHEMKPEYYTWKSSTHSEVDCVNCHISPGVKNYTEAKANGMVQVFKKTTDTYQAPIQMPKDIPNEACEKCHNMDTRNVTPTGDLIIPHDKHLEKDIDCAECHKGVAHGNISQRKVTFKSDYEKWDTELGQSLMSDKKFVNPTMEECVDCHVARQVTVECKACHTTEMYPDSHKKENFKTETHGSIADKDVKKCNNCHQYMSDEEIDLFTEQPAHTQYLQNEKVEPKKVSSRDYAKENTYCKTCHTEQRPASHKNGFINIHGSAANADKSSCLTCHDQQKTGLNKVSTVTCNSCHPSSHDDNPNWRTSHPIPVAENTKVNKSCFKCHSKPKCESCHKEATDIKVD